MSQPPLPAESGLVDPSPASSPMPMPEAVLRALPPAPARVLLWGVGETWVQELRELGLEVMATTGSVGELRAAVAEPGYEGVLVSLSEARAGGSPETEATLAETGYRLSLEMDVDDGGRLVVARKDPYAVRPYAKGDEEQILDLFAGSFHHRRPVEHWLWEYLGNPLGGPFVSLACDAEGGIVAHYAGYPVRFHATGGETLASFQIGDTMTLPAVRHVGRGPTSLLARSARHFYARACAGRVAFNYGFNVGNIQKFSIRFLRAERVEAVPYRRLAGGALGELTRRRRAWPWRRYRACRVPAVDERWDDLFDRVAEHYDLLAERRARNLRWRYLERPGFEYRIHGAFRGRRLVAWGVFTRQEDVLRWGDLLVDPEHTGALREVLRSALGDDVGRGATSVEGWFPHRPSWLAGVWPRLGFVEAPEPQGLSLMCVPFTLPTAAQELRRRLFYTLGDSDLF